MLFCALDIGGTKTMAAVMDEGGHIVLKERWPTDTADCFSHLNQCAVVLNTICCKAGLTDAAGLGIAVPGMVDANRGILLNAPFAGWRDVDVRGFFEERLRCPVYMDNDVNACAAGEIRFGHGDRFDSFLWMTISTGIGGAIVDGGRVLRGAEGLAGEIGHVKVEYDRGKVCACGQRGCLEAHASGTAITAMTIEAAKCSSFKSMFEEHKLPINAKGCAILAEKAVPQAVDIFNQAAEYIARGIGCAVNLANPQAVIIGGGVADSLPMVLPHIVESAKEYIVAQMRIPAILHSRLKYEAALYGALSLALAGLEE